MKVLHEMARSRITMRHLYIMLRLIDGEPEYVRKIADEFDTNTRAIWYIFNSYPEYYEQVDLPAAHMTGSTHGAACRAGIKLTELGMKVIRTIIKEIGEVQCTP